MVEFNVEDESDKADKVDEANKAEGVCCHRRGKANNLSIVVRLTVFVFSSLCFLLDKWVLVCLDLTLVCVVFVVLLPFPLIVKRILIWDNSANQRTWSLKLCRKS